MNVPKEKRCKDYAVCVAWHCREIRGGPIFRAGFSILSPKGFCGPYPPTPKSFQLANKKKDKMAIRGKSFGSS